MKLRIDMSEREKKLATSLFLWAILFICYSTITNLRFVYAERTLYFWVPTSNMTSTVANSTGLVARSLANEQIDVVVERSLWSILMTDFGLFDKIYLDAGLVSLMVMLNAKNWIKGGEKEKWKAN